MRFDTRFFAIHLALIHRSAWNRSSRKFAVAISEPQHVDTANAAEILARTGVTLMNVPTSGTRNVVSGCDLLAPSVLLSHRRHTCTKVPPFLWAGVTLGPGISIGQAIE